MSSFSGKIKSIVLLLLISSSCFAQNWTLELKSYVSFRSWKLTTKAESEEKDLGGATIKLFQGSILVSQITSGADGEFTLLVPPNGEFIGEVSYPGCNTKRFAVSTTGVPEKVGDDDYKPTFTIKGGFVMVKPYPSIDYSNLKQSLIKVSYLPSLKNFDNEEAATQTGLALVGKVYGDEDILFEKFCAKNREGDAALKIPDCPLARRLYNEAIAIIPNEEYPVEQLKKVGACLKEMEETEKKVKDEAAAKEKARLDKLEKDKIEAERISKENEAKEKANKETLEKAAADKLAAEAAAKTKAEADKIAKENADKEKEKSKALEKEKEAAAKLEAERLAKEKAEADKLSKENTNKEKEKESLAKQEAGKLAKEKAEADKIAKQNAKKSEKEKEAGSKLDVEKLAKEKAEADKLAKETSEKEKLAAKSSEKEKELNAKSEAEKLAKEKASAEAEKLKKKKLDEEEAARKRKYEEDEIANKRKAEPKQEEILKGKPVDSKDVIVGGKKPSDSDPDEMDAHGTKHHPVRKLIGVDQYKEYVVKGNDYFKHKRYEEAKAAFEEALKHKEEDAYAKKKIEEIEKILKK